MIDTIITMFNNGAALKDISSQMYGTPFMSSHALHQLKIWERVYPELFTKKIK